MGIALRLHEGGNSSEFWGNVDVRVREADLFMVLFDGGFVYYVSRHVQGLRDCYEGFVLLFRECSFLFESL